MNCYLRRAGSRFGVHMENVAAPRRVVS